MRSEMEKLTSVIIARNEERNIERCVSSVVGLGRVIVADTGSSDRTADLAGSAGAEVHRVDWRGFGPTKQAACDLAETEYVLSIDADEVVSTRLAKSIGEAIEDENAADGYRIPRVTNFCGQWIFHSGWYPEYVLRVFSRNSGRFTPDQIHESVICDGRVEDLAGLLLHFSYDSLADYVRKMSDYATLGAEKFVASGRRLAPVRLLVNPPVWFIKKFIVQQGFADGLAGLWIAVMTAAGQFLKYWRVIRGRSK